MITFTNSPRAKAGKAAPSFNSGFLQRKCACGGTPGPTGECEECRRKRIQTKLAIGSAEGPLEREADAAAREVSAGRNVSVSGRVAGASGGESAAPEVDEALRSPGQPLDRATRVSMEGHFGHDFSRVRIHTGERAARSARAVDALAYTLGPNVVFAAGQFAPGMAAGNRLLAHELTHVVQQHRGGSGAESLQRAPAGPIKASPSSDEETAAPEEESQCTTAPAGVAGGGNVAADDDASCRGSADKYTGPQLFVGKYPPALTAAFGAVFNPLQSWLDSQERHLGQHFPILNGKPLPTAPADVARQILGPEKNGRPGVKIQAAGRRRLAFFDLAGHQPNLAESSIVLPNLTSATNSNWTLPNAEPSKVASWLASAGAGNVPIEFRGSDQDCYNRGDPVRFVVSFSKTPLAVIEEHEKRHAEDWRKTFCRIIGGRDRKITKRTGAENSRAGWTFNDPAKAEERARQALYRGIDSKLATAEKLLARQDQAKKNLHGVSRLNIQLNKVIVKEQCEVVLVDAGMQPRRG